MGARTLSGALRRAGAGALLVLAPAGCRGEPHPGSPPARTPVELPAAPPVLDPTRVEAGDTVAGLRVAALEAAPDAVEGTGWTGSARLEGVLELAGEYRPHPGFPEVRETCFFPDSASAARLPRFPNDRRTSWLCFENPDEAHRALGEPPARGAATLEVDGVVYRYQHSDVHNTARLRRVLRRLSR